MKRILVLEPYDGGSHARFLDGLATHLPAMRFHRLGLPARGWKWRMRWAALDLARRSEELFAAGIRFDAVLASTFLNLAEFRALAPAEIAALPAVVYFHENQLTYPNQINDPRDLHFGITNVISGLAARRLVFNTQYNRDSFLDAIPDLIRKAPDMDLSGIRDTLLNRSRVMPVPIDMPSTTAAPLRDEPPTVLWNHRWEHDKNPDEFFETLFSMADDGLSFRVAVAGQEFRHRPPIFDVARERLRDRIVQWGRMESRDDYLQLLGQSAICVSTALHEFQGLSVLEAAAAGCKLVLPDRLSYPELFPDLPRYRNQPELRTMLEECLREPSTGEASLVARAAEFSWDRWAGAYESFFTELTTT